MNDNNRPNYYPTAEKSPEALTPDPEEDLQESANPLGLQEKKKVAILVVLLAAGLGVVAFQFLRGRGPKPAAAMPTGATSAALPSVATLADVDEILKQLERETSGQHGADMSVARVEQLVEEFDGYAKRRQVSPEGLRVNPFRAGLSEGQREQQEQADEEAELEAGRQQIRDAAAKLKLGSVMVAGSQRLAIVSGKVCRVGDVVEGFQVYRIEPDRVVLVRMGVAVDLRLFDGTERGG